MGRQWSPAAVVGGRRRHRAHRLWSGREPRGPERPRGDLSGLTGGDGQDRFGHGTHVAALIAGEPASLSDGSDYRGIAYGAHVVNLRVLDPWGSGRAGSVIQAIDWAIEHRDRYRIRVVNISIGAPVLQPYRDDPLCEAVERAAAAGLLVVTSAGNLGRLGFGSITSPANDPAAIAVGALDTLDTPSGTTTSWPIQLAGTDGIRSRHQT